MTAPQLTIYHNGVNQVSGDQLNTFVQWCPSVAVLRNFIGISNVAIYLEGYVTPGDGGQGFFYWNSTGTGPDDNGVTAIIPNGAASGCWSRLGFPGLILSGLTVTGNTALTNLTVSGTASLANLAFTSTTGIVGTTTNNSAATGSVGEYISSQILVGSSVPLTTNTPANITSLALTAGDWDVWGTVATAPAGSTTTAAVVGAVNTVSATLPAIPGNGAYTQIVVGIAAGNPTVMPVGMTRISIATSTTVYLVINVNFATSTMNGYGFIGARRVR